jgi:serine/threonine protein kinase
MGIVYRARDSRLARDVAIKVLPVEFASDPGRLARFEREARLLASLSHPTIATLHGLNGASGLKYLLIELVPGESRRGQSASPDPTDPTVLLATRATPEDVASRLARATASSTSGGISIW